MNLQTIGWDGIRKAVLKGSAPTVRVDEGIVAFVEGLVGFRLDPEQAAALSCEAFWVLVNCFRQWGKSTMTAGKAVHVAWTCPGSLVLVASPSLRQSAEFLRKAEEMLRALGVTPRGDGDNALSLLFPNGSRIVGLPGNEDTVRGFSGVKLLILDEASRIPDRLYHSLRPSTVAANGAIWMLSTPNGRQGFFYNAWRGEEGWSKFEVPAWQCGRFPKERLEQERRALGDRVYAQEYECQFLDSDTQLLAGHYLEGAVRADVAPLRLFEPGGLWRWFVPEDAKVKWREFAVGLDLGKQRNPAAIAVIERKCVRTGRQLAWDMAWEEIRSSNVRYLERMPVGLPYHETVERVRQVVRDPELQKGKVELVVDATGVGEMPLEALQRQHLGCAIVPVTVTGGDRATKDSRGRWSVPRWELLTDLGLMFENGELGIAGAMEGTERLMAEMRGWRVVPGERRDRIVGGADGDGKDDLAFAVALASWRSRRVVREMDGRRRVV